MWTMSTPAMSRMSHTLAKLTTIPIPLPTARDLPMRLLLTMLQCTMLLLFTMLLPYTMLRSTMMLQSTMLLPCTMLLLYTMLQSTMILQFTMLLRSTMLLSTMIIRCIMALRSTMLLQFTILLRHTMGRPSMPRMAQSTMSTLFKCLLTDVNYLLWMIIYLKFLTHVTISRL